MKQVKNINELCNHVGSMSIGSYDFNKSEVCNSIDSIREIVKDEVNYINNSRLNDISIMIDNAVDMVINYSKNETVYLEYGNVINYVLLIVNNLKISEVNKHNLLFYLAILSVNVSELYNGLHGKKNS